MSENTKSENEASPANEAVMEDQASGESQAENTSELSDVGSDSEVGTTEEASAETEGPEMDSGAGSESDSGEEEFELSPDELKSLLKRSEERDVYLDELRRMKAEFDNYQKRVRRERPGWEAQAVRRLIQDLLPIIDTFERAMESAENATVESLAEGVSMTLTMALQTLESHKVKEIQAKGEEFDPNFHEAILQMPTDDPELDGKVIDVQQKGYTHGDAIVRPSKVVVGKAQTPAKDSKSDSDKDPKEEEASEEKAKKS